MVSGSDWGNYFNNSENKKDLITLVCSYFQTDENKVLFEIPLIINNGENALGITKETIKNFITLKNHEAEKRLIFRAGISNEVAVIVVKDMT